MKEKITHWSHQKQLLGKQGKRPEQVLKSIIGVYSSHPTAPLSLAVRLKSFDKKSFMQLDSQKLAYRIPAMRLSVYMQPMENAGKIFAACIPTAESGHWEKRYSQKGRDIPSGKYGDWKAELLQLLKEPMKVSAIKKEVSIPDDRLKMVLNRMAFERLLLRVGPDSLRSNIISYVSTQAWTGREFKHIDEAKALEWLAGEYLRAFGPARRKDFQWWAGITATKAKAAIANLDTVELENELLLLKSEETEFDQFKTRANDTVDLLPQWDSYTMGYAPDGRQRFVSGDMQDQVYGMLGATGGNALGTVLINGAALGSWKSRFKGTKMQVDLNMFEKPTAKVKQKIEAGFEEIGGLLEAKKIVFQ